MKLSIIVAGSAAHCKILMGILSALQFMVLSIIIAGSAAHYKIMMGILSALQVYSAQHHHLVQQLIVK